MHGSSHSTVHSFSSQQGSERRRTHRFGLRAYVLAVIACQQFLKRKQQKVSSFMQRDAHLLQSETRRKDSQIALLKSKIQSLEEKLAHDVLLQQRYQDLQEKNTRLMALFKQQEEQVHRIPSLEHQLNSRRQLIDNLRSQLAESSNPIRELKDELSLVNSQYQVAIIAKKDAEARVAKEKIARSILESEISVLKSRVRRESSNLSPMSHYRGSYSSQSSPYRLEDLMGRFNSIQATSPHDQRATALFPLPSSPANPTRHGLVPNSDHEIERD